MQIADIPTYAEQLAGVIAGSATVKLSAALRPVMVRMPEHQLSQLDALARVSGKSRSAMAVHLLEIGLQEVDKCLPPATKDLVYELRKKLLDMVLA